MGLVFKTLDFEIPVGHSGIAVENVTRNGGPIRLVIQLWCIGGN